MLGSSNFFISTTATDSSAGTGARYHRQVFIVLDSFNLIFLAWFLALGARLVAPGFGAAESTVATVATVAFRLYLIIIVQTLTN